MHLGHLSGNLKKSCNQDLKYTGRALKHLCKYCVCEYTGEALKYLMCTEALYVSIVFVSTQGRR